MSIKNLLSDNTKDWLDLKVKSITANSITESTAGNGIEVELGKFIDADYQPRRAQPLTKITTSTGGILEAQFVNGQTFRVYEDDGASGQDLKFQVGSTDVISAPIYAKQVTVSTRDVLIDSSGVLGNATSLTKLKCNIGSLDKKCDGIYKIQPVHFHWRKKDDNGELSKTEYHPEIDYGFLAEDIEQHIKDIAYYGKDGKLEGFGMKKLIPMLVMCIQKLEKRVSELEKKVK